MSIYIVEVPNENNIENNKNKNKNKNKIESLVNIENK